MRYAYEIFLKHGQISAATWNQFLLQVANFLGNFSSWIIQIHCDQNVIHYYLLSNQIIPASFELADFLLKLSPIPTITATSTIGFYYNKWNDNFTTIVQKFRKSQRQVICAELQLSNLHKIIYGTIRISYLARGKTYQKQLILCSPAQFLSINFDKSKTFLFKKFPKYLKLEKVTRLLNNKSDQALLEIDPFPYLESPQYLHHTDYDFAKHSLVIGGSGSGKSKFLASLIDKISQANSKDYKIVVIDPHDAIYQDCVSIHQKSIVNFQDLPSSIDLFRCHTDDINASVELMLSLFRSLINDSYNGRLERVLRYATYLLVSTGQFSFITLRKLLTDLEYRNQLLASCQHNLPASVSHFFLTDFNELRAQNYNDAIAPIVAFIDEMQMVPVFNSEQRLPDLTQKVQENFLNIFSFNRLKLGNKVTQTIAGLLMQQLFLLAEQKLPQHLIVIIDEVSTIENPIIARFLSELRKYNTSVILAGQYFDQISQDLRSAIFANVTNYYLFRVSQKDATTLNKNLKIKIEGSDNPDDSTSLLADLKPRECLVQISANDEILPIFKARTTDFVTHPEPQTQIPIPTNRAHIHKAPQPQVAFASTSPPSPDDFLSDDTISIESFTKTFSTNRKPKEQKP